MKQLFLLAVLFFPVEVTLAAETWDVQSDTWVATDQLGRTLSTFEQTGPPKPDKTAAMFYFLWNGRHGEQGPFDVTEILKQDPDAMQKKDSPLWGPMHAFHHWGESIFGYYVGEDEFVLRKHAQMLGDAGVDVVIFDVTNQLTYPESYRALCKVFSEVRAAGNHAPQIAFLTPFWAPEKVVRELWNDLYSKGDYEDLWFLWDGKPLIMADPNLLGDYVEMKRTNTPVSLAEETSMDTRRPLYEGQAISQYFNTTKPFRSIAACVPTWETRDSSVELSLLLWHEVEGAPTYEVVKSQRFTNVTDNSWLTLELDSPAQPQPTGDDYDFLRHYEFLSYSLVLHNAKGRVGWWSGEKHPDIDIESMSYFSRARPSRPLAMRLYVDDEEVSQIRNFFTFRKPQPDYFIGPTGPNQWSWLEVYPQHGFYNEAKEIEQVAVGIAQNAVDGRLSALSHPRAHGRSFHDGKQPGPEGHNFFGLNFEEQWKRVYELDPKAVFITGWNEWIMMRFDETVPFYQSDVVTFVDLFNHEYSRDIEPVIGGHEDAYYYQLVEHLRRFKGTRPLEKIAPKRIVIDGKFDDWADVTPEFRDTIGDMAHRDERGWGVGTRYENTTGRNDIVAAKVSRDEKNIYFYVRTTDPLLGQDEGNWMILFLDTDCNTGTGWLGYDFVFNRTQGTLEKNVGGKYEWGSPTEISYKVGEKEIELAIPRVLLGDPKAIHFKWCDNIQQTGEWSDFTLHGDSAPNDRYNYRAEF